MKKLLTVFLIGLIVLSSSQLANAKKDDIIKGGPYISAGAFMPAEVYGYPKDINFGSLFKTGATFQFGHAFALGVFSPAAIHMRVTWLEAAGALDNSADQSYKGYTFYGSVIKLGPQFSFKFSEEMAAHAYAQLAPTVMVGGEFGNSNATTGLGLTNSIGAEFEWKKLTFGAEISSGRLQDTDTMGSGPQSHLADELKDTFFKYRSNNIKLLIGLQFGKPK